MNRSLLFLPDISGFTGFVQSTEIGHSQHVISELLEVLIQANTLELQLAEVEGDALFLFKEQEIPSLEKILAQMESLFTAFYSHLKLLEKNRVCPCNACSSAPKLQLKIIAHSGELQFITVQDKRKPFGIPVIEAHRLLKNSVDSDNYILLSKELADDIKLQRNYQSKLYSFEKGGDKYDGKELKYVYSKIDKNKLKLNPFSQAKKVKFDGPPFVVIEKNYPISAPHLLEYITNYSYRHEWVEGVDKFEYNENEVTRIGTEHICIINGKQLNFITVTKNVLPGQLIYGELTTSVPQVDKFYQFYIISPLTNNSCKLDVEIYWEEKSFFKKLILQIFGKKIFQKRTGSTLTGLLSFVKSKAAKDI